VSAAWKRSIVNAAAEDAIRVDVLNDIMPMPGSFGYGTVLRKPALAFHRCMDEPQVGG